MRRLSPVENANGIFLGYQTVNKKQPPLAVVDLVMLV